MRVYFDASVIIAALLSTLGGSSCLFKYIKRKVVVGITSQTVIDEILEEDKIRKLKKSEAEIEHFIAQSGLIVRENITIGEVTLYRGLVDVEDAHLLAGAVLTKCDYLVTLDKKHLLREDVKKRFLPLKIVSPKELLEEIIAD